MTECGTLSVRMSRESASRWGEGDPALMSVSVPHSSASLHVRMVDTGDAEGAGGIPGVVLANRVRGFIQTMRASHPVPRAFTAQRIQIDFDCFIQAVGAR